VEPGRASRSCLLSSLLSSPLDRTGEHTRDTREGPLRALSLRLWLCSGPSFQGDHGEEGEKGTFNNLAGREEGSKVKRGPGSMLLLGALLGHPMALPPRVERERDIVTQEV